MNDQTPGETEVTVIVDHHHHQACPRGNAQHAAAALLVRVDRVTGELTPMCSEEGCYEPDYPWPKAPSAGTLSDDPLFRVIFMQQKSGKKAGLSNHADIAAILAPDVRRELAYDPARNKWRHYRADTGTWHACTTDVQAQPIVRDALVRRLRALAEVARAVQQRMPADSKARARARELVTALEAHVHSSGNRRFMADLAPLMASHVAVSKEQWESHMSGYLPVANGLLRFCAIRGITTLLPYSPHMYVRHEYQAQIVYDPGAAHHAGLEALLNDWWDPDERRSALQAIAYALSRCGFLEIIFWLWGPPYSAKSTVFNLLAAWFGSFNVFMHTSTALIVQRTEHATRDDDGKGHDSSLMACFDKAIVGFPEPQVTSGFLRDDAIKRMSGDTQSGRRAYSDTVDSFRRVYTGFVPCNAIPRPQNPSDLALRRRVHVLTSHHVFVTDDAHRDAVRARMTPEQIAHARLFPADPTRVPAVEGDPLAATHMLNLLAAAWHALIVDQGRKLVPSPLAARITAAYWAGLTSGQDSVVTFIQSQVELAGDSYVPKLNLWLGYRAWHRHMSDTNGAPGPLIKSEQSFKCKVAAYFAHGSDVDRTPQITTRVFKLLNPADPNNVALTLTDPLPSVHCYKGLRLRPHPAYPDLMRQE